MIIARGAEAVISLDGSIAKERIPKGYRIPELDKKIRKARTRREAKVLQKLSQLDFPSPGLIDSDDESLLRMQYIEGEKLKDILEQSHYAEISKEIGQLIATLHDNDIIHGDLTTSNMIYAGRVFFIDFGLAFFSKKPEDKAVDIHLLLQMLQGSHPKISKECIEKILEGYDASNEIKKRLEIVQKRGRNKEK